jgi:hypothetical protein
MIMELTMLTQISEWIHRISKGWVTLTALVVFLLFTALVLPDQSSKASAEAKAAGSPDMSFFYTTNDLYRMADAYGQAGREAYIRARFTFDLIWPVVYTVFLCTAISWVYRKAFDPHSLWQRMNLVPVFAILFDYLENITTSLVMWQFPNRIPLVALLAPVFTMGKWILVTGSIVLLVVGLLVGVWRWSIGRFRKASSI